MERDLMSSPVDAPAPVFSDLDLVARILGGECELFEIVMRRHNQQLYRAARAITGRESDVEDILQQAYLNAFTHLHQFEARSRLSTWLTRIVINEAVARRRVDQRPTSTGSLGAGAAADVPSGLPNPEQQAYATELHGLLEAAIDELPETYRLVYVLRDVEGMSTTETGEVLTLGDDVVKTRLHRARAMLRRAVSAKVGNAAPTAFRFGGSRCDRVVAAVLARITPPAA